MKKTLYALLAAFLSLLFLVSCSPNTPPGDTAPPQLDPGTGTPAETNAETEAPLPHIPEYFNPLTGEESEKNLLTSRPVAVILNNTKRASPQLGLSAADIVYEIPVEGGLTRLMAVFADASAVPTVGPIYDSRAYCFDFAANFDAILVEAGMNATAKDVFNHAEDLDLIDFVTMSFPEGCRRDEMLANDRGYENSLVTDAAMLAYSIARRDCRDTVSAGLSLPFVFPEYLTARDMSAGSVALKVTIPYSAAHTPYFVYSTLTDSYARYQYDEVHTDGGNGTELRFTNLILLYMPFTEIDAFTGEFEIATTGVGTGTYVYGGRSIPMVWKSEDGKSITFYEADGITPLTVARGKTHISVLSERLKSRVSFE